MPQIELMGGGVEVDLLYGREGPTPRQQRFRDSTARYKLYGGAVGGGKTVALCAEGLRLTLAYPGNRGFMCRHESKAFKNTTLVTLLRLINEIEDISGEPILSNHHRTDGLLYFRNGSTIMYGGLGEAQDVERIKSLEIGWLALDEASEAINDNYLMALSRLRWKLPSGAHPTFQVLLASNPEPGWVKSTFVIPHQMGMPLPDHEFIQALPSDNPYLPPTYIDDLKRSNPGPWVAKYLEGSWDALEGQVWPMFSYDTHVLEPFPIPDSWLRLRTIDHGQSHPTACYWMAIDPDENIFIYREYYSPGIVSRHCREIRALSGRETYSYDLLPPECWGKTREKGEELWGVYDEYCDHGIFPTQANNDVLAGINRVGEYMTVRDDHIHPLTGQPGSPRLFIFKDCRNLILEIPDYVWKVPKVEEQKKEAPKKVKDHGCDAMRYGVMSRPIISDVHKQPPFNSFMEVRKRVIHATKLAERRGLDRHTAYDSLTRKLRVV